jgi:signal transduction histidine kinase
VTWRVRDVLAIAAVLGAIATIAVALDTNVNLAFEAPELRTALETSQALIAVACAYLVFGRVKRAHSLNDLAVVFALGLLGASNVFFAALPSRGLEGRLIFQTWAPMTLRLIATTAIAWAALARERRVPARIQRPGLTAVMATDVVLAVVAIGVAFLRTTLPRGVTVGTSHPGITPDLHGHDVQIGGFLAKSIVLTAASYGFLKRSERRHDSLIGALSVACAIQSFGYLCFALYPSINTEIIQIGDLLRLGFYFVLLFGGEREIDRYWTRLADIAIFEERRRLARDLHDGVAQELAFMVSQTRLL